MKITITGSLGHIGRPLTIDLIAKGHQVTVISSKSDRRAEIESLGAIATIGSIEDVGFLTEAFTGADAVYVMLPPFPLLEDPTYDVRAASLRLATNYAEAIRSSGVKRVVHLSSIGAHLEKRSGLLIFHFIMEKVLRELPSDISITHMRPVAFYYNLYQFMDMVKGKGFLDSFIGKILTLRYYGLTGFLRGYKGLILSNYGGDDKTLWVSPIDIAMAISEELTTPMAGRKVRYVASEEKTCQEIATIIGAAVGKPYLKWVTISDKQMTDAILQLGAPRSLADDLTEMNAGMHSGLVFEDYYHHRPSLGHVKLNDFAKEFAATYHQNQ